MAEITTIASSTSNPRERSIAKSEIKLSVMPVRVIITKVIEKVRGIVNDETIAWRMPRKINRTKNIKMIVIEKPLVNSLN